ncbi:MAG: acyl-CoA synthetase [Actinoallomurus sp.]
MTDLGVGAWPARSARIRPEAVAFRQGERSVRYAEAARRVDALAAGLAGLGVRKGDRVAYLAPNDIATFEAFFAATRLGALFVPLNTRLAPPEIGYLLADCGARVLLHDPAVTEIGGVEAALAVGADLEALIESAAGTTPPDTEVGLADDALILYTSGTTGRPKGAVLTHANLTFNTMNQLAHVDVLSSDVVLCTAPLFHATGLGQVSLPAIFKGGTVVLAPRFDPAWTLGTIARLGINAFSAVPTMLQLLCDAPEFAATDLSSLRYVIYGGSPILERVARAWLDRGVPLLQGYGMTEASPGVLMAASGEAPRRPLSPGVPHFFTDVALRDASGAIGPAQGTGELLVRGPNVFRGYWNRPADTEASFTDGWFRSGDVLRADDDGWFSVVDRVKDMIISGGENIYPSEVEAAIAEYPEVVDCAVIGVADERWGEAGLAYLVLRPGRELPEATLRRRLADRLAAYKIPKYVRFTDDLPRTATGKIRKADLRAMASDLEENR